MSVFYREKILRFRFSPSIFTITYENKYNISYRQKIIIINLLNIFSSKQSGVISLVENVRQVRNQAKPYEENHAQISKAHRRQCSDAN